MFNNIPQNLTDRGMRRPVRLFNAITGEYLHIGGLTTTKGHYRWQGTRTQAANLRKIHADTGLLKGFVIIRREGVDQGETV